jgi:N-acetyl-gamma-glutamyl-phosphate/LysW-gamma-L-alpha-aminoadipyl-6-phosphate reductase
MPTGHRHIAELEQTFSQVGEKFEILMTSVAVEVVRGILVTAHTFLKTDVDEKEIWKVFLKEYRDEPFVRIVKESQGIYKYPEPKILQGSNFCEVGFEKEVSSKRVVVMSALDNLMKGAAGNAVQCMNLMMGLPESMGLEFPGLHPI